MAVQSHSPSSNLLPDLLRRMQSVEQKNISSNVVVSGQMQAEDLQSSPWLNVLKSPITACLQQPMKNKGTCTSSGKEGTCKMNKLKRTWDAACEEPFVANKAVAGMNNAFTMGTAPVFTGLRLATSGPMPADNSSSPPSTSGFHVPDFASSIQAHLDKHTNDVFLLIDSQANAIKQAIEEKKTMHTQALLSLVDERVGKRLKVKDQELEKMKIRTLELEEAIKQLSLEAQLWKNLAKNNELMALNLKQNLEQVVAQMREQHHQLNHAYHHISREEGCGESEVDDAESCQHAGGVGSLSREVKGLKEQRKCKFCRVNDVCVLLLPCRHLCLCLECDGRLDRCPLCGITKNASLQVYT